MPRRLRATRGSKITGARCVSTFTAPSRQAVDDFYRTALNYGGKDNGGYGLHPEYGADYYAAFVIDPEGYRICVRDNGIGIDPRYTDQIFEPGLKLDKSRGGGPGYGLYLARRIIESHGGAITVESAPDQGARVCFTIPP